MADVSAAAKPECPACVEENGGWTCYHGEGCIIEEAFGPTDSQKRRDAAAAATQRRWPDLTEDEQARVKRLLTPDPEDNLDDLLARMKRAAEIIQGEKP